MEPLVKGGGLRASDLDTRNQSRIIKECISEHVALIDANINLAHDSGFNNMVYDLPTVFNFANLSKADAQLLIYSELVNLYTLPESKGGRGFTNVQLVPSPTQPQLKIGWFVGMTSAERRARMRVIDGVTAPTPSNAPNGRPSAPERQRSTSRK